MLLEVFGEIIVSLGVEGVAATTKKQSHTRPVVAGIGYLLVGTLFGALSAVVFSRRLLHNDALSLLGIFLNPALFGVLTLVYGERMRRLKRATTNLATFWGGAFLAFGFAAARLAVLVILQR